MRLLTFNKEEISELLPAQALIDYDQAKDVLEKVCQSQADLTRKEMAEEVERLVRELERCLGRGIDSSFLRTFTIDATDWRWFKKQIEALKRLGSKGE